MSHHWRERAWQRDVSWSHGNLGVRRPVVGSIAWLGLGRVAEWKLGKMNMERKYCNCGVGRWRIEAKEGLTKKGEPCE